MSENKGYTVRDRRAGGTDREVCRTCGAAADPEPHTREYNHPTMDCIFHLRNEINRRADEINLLREEIARLQGTR